MDAAEAQTDSIISSGCLLFDCMFKNILHAVGYHQRIIMSIYRSATIVCFFRSGSLH